ncbi:MAG TPA: RNA polymerase sigma factor [Gammaproteobacteria bacterium]|nr:RNA polymerase sigma factor [Gammaproteobacteria bacterium]
MLVFTRKKCQQRIEAMRPRLYSIALSWSCGPDLANELVQEALLTALDKLSQLRDTQALEGWLIKILANAHHQHLRRIKPTVNLDDIDLEYNHTPDHEVDREYLIERVRHAIKRLNVDQRHVLTLVDMEGMSYTEVSLALDIRIGTVMSRLSRARSRLRDLLYDDLHGIVRDIDNVTMIREVT